MNEITNKRGWIITFAALGINLIMGVLYSLGYSAATPCAMKWFDSSKKGMIASIVVAGVGLSPVYITPITASLL